MAVIRVAWNAKRWKAQCLPGERFPAIHNGYAGIAKFREIGTDLFFRHARLFAVGFSELSPATAQMRYAIVSDLHANIRAWNAVLADLREQGADVVVCLGDVVGYGPNPAEVLEAVRSVTTNFVMGNHDAAAVGMMDYSIFNDHAREAIEWTMTALNPEAKQFLASVPLAIEAGEIFFVHAEISEPGRFGYISDSDIAKENFKANEHLVTFVGHTHLPRIFERDRKGRVTELPDNDIRLEQDKRYIVNVGSVGEPRDPEDLRARYVIYDLESREVIFRRVEFDIVSYRNDLEATTLTLRPYFLRVYEEVVEGREVIVSNGGSLVDMTVSHNSASLVDLRQVSGVAKLSSSGLLKSAEPSRAPAVIMAVAAILTLGALALWLFQGNEEPLPPVAVIKFEPEPVNGTTPREKETPVLQEVEKAEPEPEPEPEPTRAKITKTPDKPKPEPKPTPKPPEPEPIPVPEVSAKPLEVAWWRMGDGKDEETLVDERGQVSLIPIQNGKTIKALAPDPVPETQAENTGAKQLGVWQEEKSENHFALSADHSFTFEGWFFIGAFRAPVFLFGTRSNQDDGRGWHLDLRPRARGQKGESISFFHDSGKTQTQAIAEDLKLADASAHHFAIVWIHDAKPDQGAMQLYLDGEKVASAYLPHDQIAAEQFHPLRVGADFNPPKLGLDELRFTRKALQPHEFLMRAPIQGVTLLKANARSIDSWSVPENWEGGKVPSGVQNVIIGPDLTVQINTPEPPSLTGSLVLKENATLQLRSQQSESVIPRTEGSLVMFEGSRLILHSNQKSKLGPIELTGKGNIYGGISTSGHRTTRTFASRISGTGRLVVTGVNGNTIVFGVENTFSGGFATNHQGTHTFKVIAAANGCFGKGQVIIGGYASLHIQKGLENTVGDHTGLILNGPKGTLATKLILDSDETVGRFVVDDVDQGKGVFSKASHPEIISGNGKITVR